MRVLPAAAALLLLPLAACSEEADAGSRTVTVLAASSLTGTFEELAAGFEADHPGVDVRFAFDSSATLAQQAVEGAPADVLATADEATMRSASAVTTQEPVVFARNQMVLVAPADNPGRLTGFTDLAAVQYVVCVETAPCGQVAQALLETNGITGEPASFEVDVKAVLAKVVGAEADAGLVYATDQIAAGDAVIGFEVPGADAERTSYLIAPVEQTTDAELARAWIDHVVASRDVFARAGFLAP